MSAQTTATVETLTAEVRTLMIGARQVTLSVARQLDVIPLRHLTVMGRVNLRERRTRVNDGWGGNEPSGYVIGSDPSGRLALAAYSVWSWEVERYEGAASWPLHEAARKAPLIVLAGLK